jgi:ubiquitin-like-conjugating enzyme ATG3
LEPDLTETEVEDGWILTEDDRQENDLVELEAEEAKAAPEDEEIPDLDDIEDLEPEEDPNAIGIEHHEETVLRTRVYDLSVTYDKYYQTPRLWLIGYDEQSQPLTPAQMFEDIMDEYANKTVTLDPHPCQGNRQLSIHPCNHSKMMKHFIDMIESSGTEADPRLYLFVFLKFLASVVPTIEYDFTVDFTLT